MTEPDDRYSEEMRRALSAAADLVVPAGDGLAKIRERVVHRPALFAWFVAYTQDLPRRIFVSFRVAATGLTSIGSGGSPGEAAEPPDRRRRPHFNRESSWVRPTLAAMGALAIVAIAATLVLPRLTQPVSQSALANGQTGQSPGAAGGNPGSSSGQQNSSSGQPVPSQTSRSTASTRPSPTECEPPLPPPITTTASPSPSPSDTTPTTAVSTPPPPGPSESVTPTPAPAPESFPYMIGEVPPPAAQQEAAADETCATQSSTSAPGTPPPTSSPPPSPTSSPPTSSPPTSSPPPSSPPPTSTPPSLQSPEGTMTPAQPPLSR